MVSTSAAAPVRRDTTGTLVTSTRSDTLAIPVTHPEYAVVRALLDGDEQAFSRLVSTHHGALQRVARSYLRTEAAADEVVQETWMALLDGLPRFQGRSSLKTWLFRVLANRARTRARKEGRSVPVSSLGSADDSGGPALDPDRFTTQGMWARAPVEFGGAPDSFADRAEIRLHIRRAVATLPDRQRVVITMRDLEGLSSDEVCNVLAISATNQRVLLHRARTKVRAALERFVLGEA